MIPLERLQKITERFQYLEAAMAAGGGSGDIAALAKEYSDLRPVVEQIAAYPGCVWQVSPCLALCKALRP